MDWEQVNTCFFKENLVFIFLPAPSPLYCIFSWELSLLVLYEGIRPGDQF